MQSREEIRPFAPGELRPDDLYAREVKAQIRKIVLVVGAYFFLEFVVIAGVIEAVIMFSSGFMNDLMRSATDMAQDGGALGMGGLDELIESSTSMTQEIVAKYGGVITIISAVAGLPIFLLLRGKRLFTTDLTAKHAPLSWGAFTKLWLIAMGAQFVFATLTYLINLALESSGRSVTELMNESMQMLQTPTGLLYICLIGPIVEEIIFRGAIMRSLERFGLNFSIVISSLIFGLFHIITVQAVFAFVMGLILGYIASRYSIKWSILAHILINSVATGLESLGAFDGGDTGQGPLYQIVSLVFFVIFLAGIALLIQERWRIAEQKAVGAPFRIPGSPARTGAALWRAAFTSIPLLVYLVLTLGAGIAMIFIPTFTLSG
jgi:membrane protease YdiL (CAAX protease family)